MDCEYDIGLVGELIGWGSFVMEVIAAYLNLEKVLGRSVDLLECLLSRFRDGLHCR